MDRFMHNLNVAIKNVEGRMFKENTAAKSECV